MVTAVERTRTWKQNNPRAHKAQALRSRYDLTADDYDAMVLQQQGLCAICGRPPKRNRLHVDHCHTTKRVRGLLCVTCNTRLAVIEDPSKFLTAALAYLHRSAS